MLKFSKNAIILLVIVLLSSACNGRITKYGYMFELSDVQMVQKGITSKDRVLRLMGSPTLVLDNLEPEKWIYYEQDVKNFLFFKPKTIAREILVLEFDKNQTVSNIEKYDLSNDKTIHFSRHFTEVKSKETGFFAGIFSNIGQVKPQ